MGGKKSLIAGAFQFKGSSDIYKNLTAIERGIVLAAESKVRLLLTQECALCGYPPVEVKSINEIDKIKMNEAFKRISALSIQHDMFIALGMITFKKNIKYNSVYMINPDSRRTKPYHKRALWGWDCENFTPGSNAGSVYNIDGIKAGIRICYEAQFPEYFRELFCKRADIVLVSFAHTGHVEQTYKYEVEKSNLVSRACENATYVLSANSASSCQLSPTCLINPDGKIMGIAPKDREYLLTGEIIIEEPDFGRKGRIFNSNRLLRSKHKKQEEK